MIFVVRSKRAYCRMTPWLCGWDIESVAEGRAKKLIAAVVSMTRWKTRASFIRDSIVFYGLGDSGSKRRYGSGGVIGEGMSNQSQARLRREEKAQCICWMESWGAVMFSAQ